MSLTQGKSHRATRGNITQPSGPHQTSCPVHVRWSGWPRPWFWNNEMFLQLTYNSVSEVGEYMETGLDQVGGVLLVSYLFCFIHLEVHVAFALSFISILYHCLNFVLDSFLWLPMWIFAWVCHVLSWIRANMSLSVPFSPVLCWISPSLIVYPGGLPQAKSRPSSLGLLPSWTSTSKQNNQLHFPLRPFIKPSMACQQAEKHFVLSSY